MKQTIWKTACETLQNAKQVLVCCHDFADPDAINAVVAFQLFLRGRHIPSQFPYYRQLPAKTFILDADFALAPITEVYMADYGAMVVLDTGSTHLMGEAESLLAQASAAGVPTINIDHHKTNSMYADINIVEPSTAAVCELLYGLFQASGEEITPAMAHALLGGIFGDTLILRTSSVTAKTLRVVARLMDLGADRTAILEQMPTIHAIEGARIWGKLLTDIRTAGPKDNIAYAVVDYDTMQRVDYGNISGISGFMRDVGGVDVGLLFLHEEPQQIRVEFRGKVAVDVGAIAESLGGGGHRGASGCRLHNMTMDAAIQLVLERVEAAISKPYT